MKSLYVSTLTATFGVITASSVYAIPLETSNQPFNDLKVSVGSDYKTNNGASQKTIPTIDCACPVGSYAIPGNSVFCEISKAINNENLSFYAQTMVKTGGNTAILGGYDGGIKSTYAAGYLRTGDLSSTLGLDKGGLRGSLAYSVGSISPFVALQNSQTHLGVDFRVNDTVSANVSYRTDGAYIFGLRLDNRQDFNQLKAVKPLVNIIKPVEKTTQTTLNPSRKPTTGSLKIKPAVNTNFIKGRG